MDITQSTKKCRKCGQEKETTEFRRGKRSCRDCEKIYQKERLERLYNRQGTSHIPTTKICGRCKEEKPASEFSPDNHIIDGLRSKCKECERQHYYQPGVKERIDENRANWTEEQRRKSRDSSKRSKLKRQYGLTEEDLKDILEKQDGACAICGGPPGKQGFHIDHNHDTGKVRGLLCGVCNTSLGGFRDSTQVLESAILYLKGGNQDAQPKGSPSASVHARLTE